MTFISFKMEKSKLKINLLSILLILNVCESNDFRKCIPDKTTKERGFTCNTMSMAYVNTNLTHLTATERIWTPINLKLKHIKFPSFAHKSPMLPKNFFTANIAVISLSMHEMQLYSIERDAFHNKQFYNLKILKFSRMPIMNFLDGIFNGLHNLKILTLDHVLIHKFGPNVFKPLLSLQSVSIKYCDDHIINIDNLFGFDNLTKLQTVEIEYCNLKDTITNTTFAGLQNIRNLSLRYNQIEQIGLKSFDVPLKTLDMLSLNWNKLKFIPDNLFETDDQFQTNRKLGASIELINNPWHCDYKMENFRQFIRKYIHLKIDPIICKTPFKYSGVYLVKTDDLCNETNEARPIKGLIESKPINEVKFVEEHLSIDISHKDSISVQCKLIKRRIPYSNQQTVHLTKPFDNAVHPVQNKNGKLILDSKYFPMNFSLIGFEESFNNTNKKASNCFINNKDTKSKKVIIKSELIPNVAFQFCWTENGTNLITPLNCMPFHWFVNEDDDNDFWLKIEHKPIVITISVISAAVAPFIGISIACILAKVFPREIRGRRPIQTIASFLTPKEIETVKRIRLSDVPFRRQPMIQYRQPMIQMSSIFGLSDIPPPLPPRNNTPKSSSTESIYYEIS